MARRKKLDRSQFDRLMAVIGGLLAMPDRRKESYRKAGTILEQVRERADLHPEDVGPLYAEAFGVLYPDGNSSLGKSSVSNWENGKNPPLHGRPALLALFSVYILASMNDPFITPDVVENVLFLYNFRRLEVDEIKALFPHGAPAPGAGNLPGAGDSLRRREAFASADMHYDGMSVEARISRLAAWIVADPDRPVLRSETIDEIESKIRTLATRDAGPSEFKEFLHRLVNVSDDDKLAALTTLVGILYDEHRPGREQPARSGPTAQ